MQINRLQLLVCVCLVAPAACRIDTHLKGEVEAVYSLLERVLPGSSPHFGLSFVDVCGAGTPAPCFEIRDGNNGTIVISATGANELSSGLGYYLRSHCNMTIGWDRGGGSNIFLPQKWPKVGKAVIKRRVQAWSYMMNVCTHSYSLVWYSWDQWSSFIDWMALSGINLVLAMTGQEEVQYKVFQAFGLNDTQIRTWFNGPALLTWSRGQNEYGSNIAGPLPRSWMKAQWELQKLILARYRSLGIVGQLPGYQGNAPIGLKQVVKDPNITDNKKGTGWLNSLDPLFDKIADKWMEVMIEDFGTDHWYQLDGYFDGSTAPWLSMGEDSSANYSTNCTYAKFPAKYLAGCSLDCKSFKDLPSAQAACNAEYSCSGITQTTQAESGYQLRTGSTPLASPRSPPENSWLIENSMTAACHQVEADKSWYARGAAAYSGLNRTDPNAIWSFQGWAFVGWNTPQQASYLKGFVDATPKDKFVVIDMSTNGEGEWQKWNHAAYWGAPFIWTTLHDFGGTDGMKGNLAQINQIPFTNVSQDAANVVGTGFTPEGIDQNPVYYEAIIEQNYHTAPVQNITAHAIDRAYRRYGITEHNNLLDEIWALLVESAYAQDLSVQDNTGVAHLPGSASQFTPSTAGHVPSQTLCKIFSAWKKFIQLASQLNPNQLDLEPFHYDLTNLGREVLAQLSTPLSQNFSAAFNRPKLQAAELQTTASVYIELLNDMDSLVATDVAFLLGPWLQQARAWGANASDCIEGTAVTLENCPHFYEWNARTQLTTWNPTRMNDTKIPDGPIDYASKHWSGLISDYYAKRALLVLKQALNDAANGAGLNKSAVEAVKARHAYDWTTSQNVYPCKATGNLLALSEKMLKKYTPYYESCLHA